MRIHNGHIRILLADDDVDDRLFFKEAISEINSGIILETVVNGEELMDKISATDAIFPDYIFLDLNMPCKNGFECLDEIKSNERFENIIVVIYSTSSNQTDINESYKKGANLYLRKPVNYSELKDALTRILGLKWEKYIPVPRKEKFVWKGTAKKEI